jgi:hypothetical protein
MGFAPVVVREGMAEYLSLGPIDAQTAMWVRGCRGAREDAERRQTSDPNFFPYRYGHAFWAYVGGHWGDKAVSDLLFATANGATIDTALETCSASTRRRSPRCGTTNEADVRQLLRSRRSRPSQIRTAR